MISLIYSVVAGVTGSSVVASWCEVQESVLLEGSRMLRKAAKTYCWMTLYIKKAMDLRLSTLLFGGVYLG